MQQEGAWQSEDNPVYQQLISSHGLVLHETNFTIKWHTLEYV